MRRESYGPGYPFRYDGVFLLGKSPVEIYGDLWPYQYYISKTLRSPNLALFVDHALEKCSRDIDIAEQGLSALPEGIKSMTEAQRLPFDEIERKVEMTKRAMAEAAFEMHILDTPRKPISETMKKRIAYEALLEVHYPEEYEHRRQDDR